MTRSRKPNRSTRSDVAKLAGVSTAVVSYVFNDGPKPVAADTKQKVLKAAAKLNYQPNSMAKALRAGTSKLFGVIVPDFSNPFFANMNDSLEKEATKAGYSVLFMSSHLDGLTEQRCISRLLARDVDAVFGEFPQSGEVFQSLDARGCPFILFDYSRQAVGAKVVSSDFRQATQLATNHLLSHGYRHIAMLLGHGADPSDPRVQAWSEVHHAHKLPVGPIVRSDFTREGAYKATLSLLDNATDETGSGVRPEAIFACSDLEAIGALRALHERGIRVPEDMGLISFDGTKECLYTYPQLSSLRQDTKSIAKLAVKTALNPDAAPDVQLVPVQLDLRRSCGH
ncbi:LacI family DNA-binding transcriptional regulator [Bifidobacterium sp. ESL0775]|uniref:LacI family DNA-binding transcriptional regulator n=1 Tax=Bifidobacterium sp. ESL0775 TaxID=2983230 RepID=UPI0023F99430|nr:LacI family DNA-binding transcriptional regulator [Bifidobacterium sp. ESL0775]WEV69386.1 LacI family DNA-binding transcriptional regulator [Bifidobacterium sp. ESL0775]